MAEVLFYHLERSALEDVLPGLLEKSLARGWRARVVAASTATADALDQHLWTYRDESFLPHGRLPNAMQPVLLSALEEEAAAPLGAEDGMDVLFLVAGATTPVETFAGYARTVVMFDGAGADTARALWKEVASDSALEGTYWRQTARGGWEKAA